MIPDGYVQALVDYAEAIEDVTPLETERDALFARMNNGGKLDLVNCTLAGKSFGFAEPDAKKKITVEEKFTSYVAAVKQFKGQTVPMTYAAFGRLIR